MAFFQTDPLRRHAGRSLGLSMTALVLFVHALAAAWLLFVVHPVLSILLLMVAGVLLLLTIKHGRISSRAFDAIDAAERLSRLPSL